MTFELSKLADQFKHRRAPLKARRIRWSFPLSCTTLSLKTGGWGAHHHLPPRAVEDSKMASAGEG